MKNQNATVALKAISVTIAVLMLLGALFIFYGSFTAQQATIETKLAHIQRDIAVLTTSISSREDVTNDLTERIAQLEIKVRNLERRLDNATG